MWKLSIDRLVFWFSYELLALATIGANIVSEIILFIDSNHFVFFIFQLNFYIYIEGVRAKVYFKAIPELDEESGLTFLTVDKVKMDFSVKEISMGVDNVANGNTVIRKNWWHIHLRSGYNFCFVYLHELQKPLWIYSSTAMLRSY